MIHIYDAVCQPNILKIPVKKTSRNWNTSNFLIPGTVGQGTGVREPKITSLIISIVLFITLTIILIKYCHKL